MNTKARNKGDGKPFNLDGLLGVPKNRIAEVGFELEGGWMKVPSGAKIDGDGSVFKDPITGLINLPHPSCKKGEIQLGPMLPGSIPSAMKKYYPKYVDKTCGLHIHMSFETLRYYSMLMDGPEYQATIVYYLLKWAEEEGFPADHHIWPRLKGKNEFCKLEFCPDLQVSSKKDFDHFRKGNRYTAIAYRHGYAKTIECRVLPMMDTYQQAVRALRMVIDITNACLLVLGGKDKFKGELVLAENEEYTEYSEHVI